MQHNSQRAGLTGAGDDGRRCLGGSLSDAASEGLNCALQPRAATVQHKAHARQRPQGRPEGPTQPQG